MEAPGSARFMMHLSYKPTGTDWLGSLALPARRRGHGVVPLRGWGNPAPVDRLGLSRRPAIRTGRPETLAGVAARYPMLDLTPWREHRRGQGHSDMDRLAGKVAIVTGGGGGIGGATARALAREGAAVLVVDINEAAAVRLWSRRSRTLAVPRPRSRPTSPPRTR